VFSKNGIWNFTVIGVTREKMHRNPEYGTVRNHWPNNYCLHLENKIAITIPQLITIIGRKDLSRIVAGKLQLGG
jgi:hypothetical protein